MQTETGEQNDQLQPSESLNKKGKSPEIQENFFLKKNGSSTEAMASTSEKDSVLTKSKADKSRQTQSGPLVPGVVLTHSSLERGRNSDRFVIFHY